MAVSIEFSLVAVNDFLACPIIFLVNCKVFFKKADCNVPLLVVLVPVVQFLKKYVCLAFAECFCNLALYKLEEVNFLRNELNEL